MYLRTIPLALVVLAIGCGQPANVETEAGDPTSEAVAAAFNPEGLPTVALDVPAIHCEMCAMRVTVALEEQPGVKDVSVDVENKTATVAVDESAFDAEAAIAALDEAEFAGSTLQTEDAAVAAPEATSEEG